MSCCCLQQPGGRAGAGLGCAELSNNLHAACAAALPACLLTMVLPAPACSGGPRRQRDDGDVSEDDIKADNYQEL